MGLILDWDAGLRIILRSAGNRAGARDKRWNKRVRYIASSSQAESPPPTDDERLVPEHGKRAVAVAQWSCLFFPIQCFARHTKMLWLARCNNDVSRLDFFTVHGPGQGFFRKSTARHTETGLGTKAFPPVSACGSSVHNHHAFGEAGKFFHNAVGGRRRTAGLLAGEHKRGRVCALAG